MHDTQRRYTLSQVAAGALFGLGLAMGLVPIALASCLIRKNLFIECMNRMDLFWQEQSK